MGLKVKLDDPGRKCYQTIASLLAKERLLEAFSLIHKYLTELGFPTNLTPFFVAASAQFHRTEKEHHLGTIPWDDYNISNSQVIQKTLSLAEKLCKYKHDENRSRYYVLDAPGFKNKAAQEIEAEFAGLAKEIVTMEFKKDRVIKRPEAITKLRVVKPDNKT